MRIRRFLIRAAGLLTASLLLSGAANEDSVTYEEATGYYGNIFFGGGYMQAVCAFQESIQQAVPLNRTKEYALGYSHEILLRNLIELPPEFREEYRLTLVRDWKKCPIPSAEEVESRLTSDKTETPE